ncbi:MAG: ROK family protein [Acidobacteriota bacterium]|nr:ROK family protein [Acidobacteriota bacterium]
MENSARSPILCVDIGGSSAKAGLLYANGELIHVDSIATKPDAESFMASLIQLIAKTRAAPEKDQQPEPIRLGIAVAGFLDPERTCLIYNSNLSWLEGFPLRRRLQQEFPGLTIELEVDSNAATMAEYRFGSGQGSSRFLCVTSGTGLGVGMTINGAPLRFAYGCLGDIGHTIVLRDGPLCTCGGRGCAEILVSAVSVAANYKQSINSVQDLSLRDVIEAAHRGETAAISVLQNAGEWLGVAVASMANTFFPDHIAIAGGLSAGGDFVLKPAERVFRESACVLARSTARFTRATLGSTATLIGAACPFWEGETNEDGKPISR